MQPIQIQINVNVGLNEALQGLLSAMMGSRTEQAVAVRQAAMPEQAAEPAPAPVREPEPAGNPEKEYTDVDIRAAIDRARRRIEGENYKEQTDSEGYRTWHRALTAWFKEKSRECGAEKPVLLPDNASRARFIAHCDAVEVIDGQLTEDLPE